MNIEDIIDCEGCKNFISRPGEEIGDSRVEDCKIDAWDDEPCERMLGAIHDRINDGKLRTEHGEFFTGDYLAYQEDFDIPEEFPKHDFSSAYYWVPDCWGAGKVKAYKNEKEIYDEWFV